MPSISRCLLYTSHTTNFKELKELLVHTEYIPCCNTSSYPGLPWLNERLVDPSLYLARSPGLVGLVVVDPRADSIIQLISGEKGSQQCGPKSVTTSLKSKVYP